MPPVKVTEISTSDVNNLNNDQICTETTIHPQLGYYPFGTKDTSGNVLQMLAVDQLARVLGIEATGSATYPIKAKTSAGNETVRLVGATTGDNSYIKMYDSAESAVNTIQSNGETTQITATTTQINGVESVVSNHATQPGLKVAQSGTGNVAEFLDGATEVVTFKDGGNVGIGDDDPLYKLVVKDNKTVEMQLEYDGATDTKMLLEQRNTTGSYIAGTDETNTTQFAISAGGDSYIKGGHSFGFGTNTPVAPIEMQGPVGSHIRYTVSGSAASGVDGGFSSATGGFKYSATNGYLNDSGVQKFIVDTLPTWFIKADGRTSTDEYVISRAPADAGNDPTFVDLVTIKSDGKMGIGDDDPPQLLTIKGSAPVMLIEDSTDGNIGLIGNADSVISGTAGDMSISATSKLILSVGSTIGAEVDSSGKLYAQNLGNTTTMTGFTYLAINDTTNEIVTVNLAV
jgi:hypothetical protein